MDSFFSHVVLSVLEQWLPVLVGVLVSAALNAYRKAKKTERYGHVLGILEMVAQTSVAAAEQVAKQTGYDGPMKRQFVEDRLMDVLKKTGLKVKPDEAARLLDSVIEGAVYAVKGTPMLLEEDDGLDMGPQEPEEYEGD
jgi:hypothetical protein